MIVAFSRKERAGTWCRRSTALIPADWDRTSWSDRSLPPTRNAHHEAHRCFEELSGAVARPCCHLDRPMLGHHAPDKAGELPSDGDHRLVRALGEGELAKLAREAQLSRPGIGHHLGRVTIETLG